MNRIVFALCMIIFLFFGIGIVNQGTVMAGTQALRITDSSIKSGQTDVDVDTVLVVRFDGVIQKDINYGKISLTKDKGEHIAAHISNNSDALVIKPDQQLPRQEKFTLTIPKRAIKTNSGKMMMKAFVIKFTTRKKEVSDNDSQSINQLILQSYLKDGGYKLPNLKMQNFTIAQEDVVIDSDRFIVKIPKGVIYPIKLKDYVAKWMELVEISSALSFFPASKEFSKVIINVVPSESNVAFGSQEGITVAPMDLITDEICNNFTFLHELSHTIQMRNSTINLIPFMEGYAIMNPINATRCYGREDIAANIGMQNYFYFPNIDAAMDDTEKYYFEVKDWDAYLFGYRFAYYLQERYGKSIFNKIINKVDQEQTYGIAEKMNRDFISTLKECTSKDVFVDFKKWYLENKQVFENTDLFTNDVNAASGITNMMCLPIITKFYQGYPVYKFKDVHNTTLDFNDGDAISQVNGYAVKGIFGRAFSSGNHKLSFYNAQGELIYQKVVKGAEDIEVYGAVKMLITGDRGFFNFTSDFKKMTEFE